MLAHMSVTALEAFIVFSFFFLPGDLLNVMGKAFIKAPVCVWGELVSIDLW